MIIWSGRGILVGVVWLFSLFAGDVIAKALFGDAVSNAVRNLTGEWLAALLTVGLYFLLRPRRAPMPTGNHEQATQPPRRDTFFFIPIVAWPWLFFALGAVLFFTT
jgi:hypothetical protein